MTNTSDFQFEETVLKHYSGPGGIVVIPDGVTAIADLAFCNDNSVQQVFIPASCTEICDNAFVSCGSLKTVTIAGSVEIGRGAFSGCRNLKKVTIAGDATEIREWAFGGNMKLEEFSVGGNIGPIASNSFEKCELLADSKGFLILGSKLVEYMGQDTHVSVPDSVTEVISCAGKTHVSLNLPDSVTKTADYSLGGNKLKFASIPKALLENWREDRRTVYKLFLHGGLVLEVRDGAQTTYYAYAGVEPTDYQRYNCKDSISHFILRGMIAQYDSDLQSNSQEFKYKPAVRLMGMLGRLMTPVDLSDQHRASFSAELIKGAKKILAFAEEVCQPDIITRYLSLNLLDEKKKKAFLEQVAGSVVPEIAALVNGGAKEEAAAPAPEAAPEAAPAPALSPEEIARIYAQKWVDCKGITVLKNMKLVGVSMPDTKLTGGSPAPVDLFRFILVSYGKQHSKGPYGIHKEADEAAALLSYDSLCDAMDQVSGNLNGPAYPSILPMLCRYGSPRQIKALTDSYKTWGEWGNYGSKGRTAQKALEQALVLSDTRAAVVFLEKIGKLEAYAKMRGLTVDDVYEKYLFDFGFNEAGVRTFDLETTQIDVTLTPALTLEMVNRANGKTVRSIPKAKVDPVVHKKAANELDDMRQNLKKAVFLKQRQLWKDYLEGTPVSAETWSRSYLCNAFLNRIARILVWEQAGKTFLLTDIGMVNSAGEPVTLTADEIHVAHPMEMAREDIAAWQQYFTSHGLKQPFQQIWEPVLPQCDFRPDRYKSCSIPSLFFRGQEKRGIQIVWSYADYYENFDLTIDGFDVTFDPDPQDPDRVEITNLQPARWGRRANMIVAWLDKLTVYDRVKKDDPTVMDQMDAFTLAQVTEFIEAAQKSGATNVTALLLEYKNTHFGGFDPMDEFTLDF